ncbi:MAG: diaminopimelate decarboxylase [Nitrospirae bacterium]|nr:diaminopimelate decarboxylase [Nitrospirota bacterium]
MHLFRYKGNELYAEDVPVKTLADRYGTPLYVYSSNTLLRHLNAYQDAFDGFPNIICFALKANSNLSILRLLGKNGSGADIVSGGELYRALKAGIPAKRIVYAGVGKTEDEIRYAIDAGILMFNVESFSELMEIDRIARVMKKKACIALRVNPDIDPETHPYIATGLKSQKFGIPIEDAIEHYKSAARLKGINIIGIHKHLGSQITKVSPFVEGLRRTLLLVDKLDASGIDIRYLDIGGGLGITYDTETPPHPKELARHIIPLLNGRQGLTLIVEPGRSISGNAGILVSRALYIKKTQDKEFLIVDAGMNDLMRPSLYGAYHRIIPVIRTGRRNRIQDIVGPICESGDFLAKERELPRIRPGEHIAVIGAGAYGFSMSSNYNSRPLPAEVMVKGKRHFLIRKRQTYEDLIAGERLL